MHDDERTLKVNIFGTEYPLKSSTNIDYIRRVANYVDTKMKEIYNERPNRPLHQLAILTAMNITDELLHHREIDKKRLKFLEAKVAELHEKLEHGIKDLAEENEI